MASVEGCPMIRSPIIIGHPPRFSTSTVLESVHRGSPKNKPGRGWELAVEIRVNYRKSKQVLFIAHLFVY